MFSSCWSVYGLRKVLLDKKILILSDNSDDKPKNLISRIHLMYKVITPDIKRKQNNFFLKYWLSSRDFNKLVIKAKIHADTYFWNFLCYMKIQYEFYIYIFERLGRMHKNKKYFFFILTKTWYFNTGFESLQYKNTHQYWSKYSKIFWKNQIFDFFARPSPPHGAGLDPAGLAGSLDQTSDPDKQPKARVNFFTRAWTVWR